MNKINLLRLSFLLVFSVTTGVLKAQIVRKDSVAYVKALVPTKYMFLDTAGRAHSLKEFEGKYTYIDMWASWCYPCHKEYPFLEKMAGEIDTTKVQVVSISVDVTKFRWLGALGGYHMKGTQWVVTDTTFSKDFDIDRIPRMILLDKKGKVLEYSMTRPSHEETLQYLNKLK